MLLLSHTSADTSSESCVMGFLSKESLQLIVDAPRDDTIHNSFDYRQQNVLNVTINESGLPIKSVCIAAKFDHKIPCGWPVLKIRRTVNTTSPIIWGITKEPRPTGYLNVFEYDMKDIKVQRDVIHLYYSNCTCVRNGSRYSLAYFSGSSDVMISIEFYNDRNITTQNSFYDSSSNHPDTCSASPTDINPTTTKNKVNTEVSGTPGIQNMSGAVAKIYYVIGGVLCVVAVVIFLIVLTIVVFVMFRYRNHTKHFSPSSTDLYASALPISSVPTIHNPAYSTVDSKSQLYIR